MDPIIEQLISDAESFVTKSEQGDETKYIDESIVHYREALGLCSPDYPKRVDILAQLGNLFLRRYLQLGELADIEEGVVKLQDALVLYPPDHPDRANALTNLATILSHRYKQFGGIDDIHHAIALGREALELCSLGHQDRSKGLTSLSPHLFMRYQRLGGMNNLNEIIVLAREAVALSPQGHSNRSLCLYFLALYLYSRFAQLGGMADLEEAISFCREALELRSTGNYLRSMCSSNLALCLCSRFQQLGQIDDLNQAIVLARSALAMVSLGQPIRPTILNNLTRYLLLRYEQLEGIDDLNESIVIARCAVELILPQSPDRYLPFNNLANALGARYVKLRGIGDLNEAIDLVQDALTLNPPGHPDRPMSMTNLVFLLFARCDRLGTLDDLNQAINLGRESVALCPQGHPYRITSLNNLAACLAARYKKLGDIVDLNAAIATARDVVALQPSGQLNRFAFLDNLTMYLRMRFERSGDGEDLEEEFNLYRQLQHVSNAVSSGNLTAARSWISAAEYFHHSTMLLAYETALRLLAEHLAALPPLPHHLSILKDLTSSLATDAFSACLRNQSPTKAVELLEQGRGVFWSQLARLRSPLDDVIASGPEGKALADEFKRLTSLIHDALKSPGDDQHDQVFRLNVELQKVVSSIRKLPDLSRFLLPPSFSDLQRAASDGPVIIVNASSYGCDALVVFADRSPVHIPLSITKRDVLQLSSELRRLTRLAKSTDMTKELQNFLRELWDKLVSHIIGFLQSAYPIRSRIWWCPTAEFSLLPLHAATPFREDQKGVSSLYISSYTPTLTALIRARRPSSSLTSAEKKHFIAIGEANATGINKLHTVSTELTNISQLVDGPATFTSMEGQDACILRVVEELSKNEWVHFACHGVLDKKQPFESAFAMHDGRFTIRQIIQCDLANPEFAYLSACHTTVGDEESPDEAIHLASAMQFAGFRSVIGTMWAVDDAETDKVTSVFYKHMIDGSGRLDHTRAAAALRRTMKSVNIPIDQRILYIHLGA